MKESKIEHIFKKTIEEHGGFSIKMNLRGSIGFPDRLVFLSNKIIFVELKSTTGKLRKTQSFWKKKIMQSNVSCEIIHYEIINSITSIKDFILKHASIKS